MGVNAEQDLLCGVGRDVTRVLGCVMLGKVACLLIASGAGGRRRAGEVKTVTVPVAKAPIGTRPLPGGSRYRSGQVADRSTPRHQRQSRCGSGHRPKRHPNILTVTLTRWVR